MTKAGEILLLVGSIMQVVASAVVVIMAIVLAVVGASTSSSSSPNAGAIFRALPIVYGIFGAIGIVGSVFGFLSYGRAKRGDLSGAFAFGLTASLLPPLQVVLLMGAIFCKVGAKPTAGSAPPSGR